jgi:ubiquinone/menaquinone biosynthesis C-methylase UbiE
METTTMKKAILIPLAALLAGVAALRLLSRRVSLPCPAWLSVLLENPYMERVAGAEKVVARLGLEPGMAALDVGCGPGRLTVPLAQRVGAAGHVTALDIQRSMLDRAQEQVRSAGLHNVTFVHAGAGSGALPVAAFDRAVLVTVLGEIPDRAAALAEIFAALRPGGILSITEALPDPHFQTAGAVRRLATAAGFHAGPRWANPLAYTWHWVKP